MTVYLLRHAEVLKGSVVNPSLGQFDPPIRENRKLTEETLPEFFRTKGITSIHISDYIRTRQTIQSTATALGLSMTVDSRLNEIDYGALGRLSAEELTRQGLDPRDWFHSDADRRFPDGETCQEAQKRIVGLVLERKVEPGNSIMVTHGGVLRTLFCYILGLPAHRCFEFQIDPAGLMEIEWNAEAGGWRLIRFNHQIAGTA